MLSLNLSLSVVGLNQISVIRFNQHTTIFGPLPTSNNLFVGSMTKLSFLVVKSSGEKPAYFGLDLLQAKFGRSMRMLLVRVQKKRDIFQVTSTGVVSA